MAGMSVDWIARELGPVPRRSPTPAKSYELDLFLEPSVCLDTEVFLLRPRPFFLWPSAEVVRVGRLLRIGTIGTRLLRRRRFDVI